MRIVTSKQMKQIERNAVQYQMSYQRLMENAGCGAAAEMLQVLGSVEGLCCAVFCGKGNNGGDGFVVARKLTERGAQVTLVLVDQQPKTDDALQMYRLACAMGLPSLDFSLDQPQVQQLMEQVDVVVDAIYGSGFHGELDSLHQQAAAAINSAIAAVFSLDLPSGLNCDTGEAAPGSVIADFTLAFDSLKPAHLLPKYLENLGQVRLVPIGVDSLAYREVEQSYFCADAQYVFSRIPRKHPNIHKSSTGRLLNLAGGPGCAGAAVLSTRGALRCGAGYVITAVPRALYPVLAPCLIQSPFHMVDTPQDLEGALSGCSAAAVGCGMGVGPEQSALLRQLLREAACPVVIDADGINNLAADISMRAEAQAPLILTPHFGEMARLCQTTVPDIAARPIPHAQRLASQLQAIVVLKGAHTVIAAPQGPTFLNATGNPGLAKAGSGDVLTGIIAGLLSQGMEPLDAAVCGVFLHGLAADRCAQRLSVYSMQPDDLLEELPTLFLEYLE